jgi:hypothetical protein
LDAARFQWFAELIAELIAELEALLNSTRVQPLSKNWLRPGIHCLSSGDAVC